ncbi:MAG: hypothetical protein HC899_31515 [Leptolyngbyaceae cyanobacterium SM1_4_3]|nr:hypothetical protein [Leptolyngbyaceae cyanobacterium SM1_4_3]
MSGEVFEEIKNTIMVICLLQSREETFKRELEFFNEKWGEICQKTSPVKRQLYGAALKRLEHEVMFLCIETYSLHEGISKKESLYTKEIKQKGRRLSKIDNSPIDRNSVIDLGIISSEGEMQRHTSEDMKAVMKHLNQKALAEKQNLKDTIGIKSYNHCELDEWKDQLLDKKLLTDLHTYRKDFAHRLNSLENLKKELALANSKNIEKALNVVSKVLSRYKQYLRGILFYTTSESYDGNPLPYESLAKIELFESSRRFDK